MRNTSFGDLYREELTEMVTWTPVDKHLAMEEHIISKCILIDLNHHQYNATVLPGNKSICSGIIGLVRDCWMNVVLGKPPMAWFIVSWPTSSPIKPN